MNNYPEFIDKELEQKFKENGYVVVSLMSDLDCDKLIEYYKKEIGEIVHSKFYNTIQEKDLKIRTKFNDFICVELEHHIKKYIPSFTPLFGNFHIKNANSKNNVGIHQDLSCVNEIKYRSFNVWLSLIDTNKKNGGLSIMPRSHLLNYPIRYSPIDTNIWNPFKSLIRYKSISLQLKKGEALLYDNALLHFSDSNNSNEIRYACGCACILPNTIPSHFHKDGENILEYEVDHSFFNTFFHDKKPNLPIKNIYPIPKFPTNLATWISLLKL